MVFGKQFERALAAQIIMISPMAPHFASELWNRFVNLPDRATESSEEIKWDLDVFQQNWPIIDPNFPLELTFKVNNYQVPSIKIPHLQLNQLTAEEAVDLALKHNPVLEYINNRKILRTNFILYPGCEGIVNISIERSEKMEKTVKQ